MSVTVCEPKVPHLAIQFQLDADHLSGSLAPPRTRQNKTGRSIGRKIEMNEAHSSGRKTARQTIARHYAIFQKTFTLK
jgi:hypothetical protein